MSNNVLKIYKETVLPNQLSPNAIYLIAPADNPNFLEVYVTGKTADVVRRTLNRSDIALMIDERATAMNVNNLVVVDDITARNLLEPTTNLFVLVTDATGDSTVTTGSASYVYDVSTSTYTKIAEYESTDLVLSWEHLKNKPNSTVAAIDDAVSKRHTHANATQLDKIGEDASGNFTYGGVSPNAGLASANW